MHEFMSRFIAAIISEVHRHDPSLIMPFKDKVNRMFNNDGFFQMSMLNLKQWRRIMSCYIDFRVGSQDPATDELFDEQMKKWNEQGGFYGGNKSAVITNQCYAMKRLAFLIFSCDTDQVKQLEWNKDGKISGQLNQLLEKIKVVIKKDEKALKSAQSIQQRIFVFFLTRVMLIRMTTPTLTEALRKLWPHLLGELMSINDNEGGNAGDAGQDQSKLNFDNLK